MLTLYTGNNTQLLKVCGVADQDGNAIVDATIQGSITQDGNVITTVSFIPDTENPGCYGALLEGFDPPIRPAELEVFGVTALGYSFSVIVYCTISERAM